VRKSKAFLLSISPGLLISFQLVVSGQQGPQAGSGAKQKDKGDLAADTKAVKITTSGAATAATMPTNRDAAGSLSNWRLYTNNQVGYSFQYPPDWALKTVDGGQRVELSAPDRYTGITMQVVDSNKIRNEMSASSRVPPRCIFKLRRTISGAPCFENDKGFLRTYVQIDHTTLSVTSLNPLRRPAEFDRVVSSLRSTQSGMLRPGN
jgi:hypothetical protein